MHLSPQLIGNLLKEPRELVEEMKQNADEGQPWQLEELATGGVSNWILPVLCSQFDSSFSSPHLQMRNALPDSSGTNSATVNSFTGQVQLIYGELL